MSRILHLSAAGLVVCVASLAAACGSDDGTSTPVTAEAGADADVDTADAGDSGDAAPNDGATPDADASSPCPPGTSLTKEITCSGAPLTAPAALVADLAAAQPGDVVSLAGMPEGTAPCLPSLVCTPDDAPSLVFSDDPESPAADGVLYADTVTPRRPHRIYVYHANGGNAARKFPVVVLNQGAADASVTIRRRGLAGPSKAYVTVGKTALAGWFASVAPITVPVPAGQRVLLDAALDALHAGKDDLVHAIYDVEVSAPLKLSVVSVLAGADAAQATAGLSLLPRDGNHARGTFPGADVLVTKAAPRSGVQHLRLGANEVDPDLVGVDATTGAKVTLVGNYGVRYRLALGLPSATQAAMSPRGGAWGGVASLPAVTLLPSASESTSTSAVALGAIGTTEIALASGGGSNLPVDLFLVTP